MVEAVVSILAELEVLERWWAGGGYWGVGPDAE